MGLGRRKSMRWKKRKVSETGEQQDQTNRRKFRFKKKKRQKWGE